MRTAMRCSRKSSIKARPTAGDQLQPATFTASAIRSSNHCSNFAFATRKGQNLQHAMLSAAAATTFVACNKQTATHDGSTAASAAGGAKREVPAHVVATLNGNERRYHMQQQQENLLTVACNNNACNTFISLPHVQHHCFSFCCLHIYNPRWLLLDLALAGYLLDSRLKLIDSNAAKVCDGCALAAVVTRNVACNTFANEM
ncbi:unnamed protein product [Ceratitis capitata]|uniref:(Mediterranean fruit fly) hypothetical protein n=1 Tax=Ceratitis capitata TaxID=7213 RepID=A0A811VBL8_CERCA|nr:unnamed protein product [Ceratitis capitata]